MSAEDELSIVAARHNIVETTFYLDSGFSSHSFESPFVNNRIAELQAWPPKGEGAGLRLNAQWLCPEVSIECPVLNRFADVGRFYAFPSLQISKRSTHFENSIVGASR